MSKNVIANIYYALKFFPDIVISSLHTFVHLILSTVLQTAIILPTLPARNWGTEILSVQDHTACKVGSSI